jgi:hypothetical protein
MDPARQQMLAMLAGVRASHVNQQAANPGIQYGQINVPGAFPANSFPQPNTQGTIPGSMFGRNMRGTVPGSAFGQPGQFDFASLLRILRMIQGGGQPQGYQPQSPAGFYQPPPTRRLL